MSEALTMQFIENTTGMQIGAHDISCPLCGPDRKSAHNRVRRVLRVFIKIDGFVSYSCARCGADGYFLPDGKREVRKSHKPAAMSPVTPEHDNRQRKKAAFLWSRSVAAEETVTRYLRESRRYGGAIPPTVRFLPARFGHHPAMITAFGMAEEVECGRYEISPESVQGVHLTLLKDDGSGKAGTDRDKIMVGPSKGFPIMLAPPNDGQGLIISEGIENGLSAHEATGLGLWVAGSAGRLGSLAAAIPSFVECVTIVTDDDISGRKGARALAYALSERNIEVLSTVHLDEEEAAA